MVFHEITKEAIQSALDNPRPVDERLVDSQETRRILDRLYGYEVSPVLWKKVMPRLSAGRVQSVATRLVVERERERMEFISASYWDIEGFFDPGGSPRASSQLEGKRVAQGRDFGPDGQLKADARQLAEEAARGARRSGSGRAVLGPLGRGEAVHAPAGAAVHDLDAPAGGEPQAALHRADDDASRPATLRARLHHLHAHRLDDALRDRAYRRAHQARELYGADYVPDAPRRYDRKVKNAQEATRRSGPPASASGSPTRCAASSTATSRRSTSSSGCERSPRRWPTRAGRRSRSGSARPRRPARTPSSGVSGTVITFRGFLAAYEEGRDESTVADDEERPLPPT